MDAMAGMWPTDSGEHEALTTAASGKELSWAGMDEQTREAFRRPRRTSGASGLRMRPSRS